MLKVGLTGDEAVIETEHAERRLHETGHGEAVAGEGFGASYGWLESVEEGTKGEGFGLVAGGGGGSMSVDMIDIFRGQASVTEGEVHGAEEARAFGVRAGGVETVAGLAPAGNDGLDAGAALSGAGGGLQDEGNAAARGEEAIPMDVKGTRGGGGIGGGAKGTHAGEGEDGFGGEFFRGDDEHALLTAKAYLIHSKAESVAAGGAGGDEAATGAVDVEECCEMEVEGSGDGADDAMRVGMRPAGFFQHGETVMHHAG